MQLVEQEQLAFEIGPDTPPERCAEIYGRWLAFKREVRRVDELMKAALIERGGEFEIGSTRYYCGTEKTTRLRDPNEAVALLLEILGPAVLAQLLASDGLKQGACRDALREAGQEEVWDHLFSVESKDDIKTGKAAKALLSVNESYMPQSRREKDE